MTRQLIKAFEILQMGNLELSAQTFGNPVLEIDYHTDDILPYDEELEKLEWLETNDYFDDGRCSDFERSSDYIDRIQDCTEETLADYLLNQLNCMNLENEVYRIARQIIGYLDDDGYLVVDVKDISARINVSAAKVTNALKIIQSLEP